jgi:phosphoglycerate kinase
MNIVKMTDIDLSGKYVLIREDFNVPINQGKITSTTRIDAALPGIRTAIKSGAKLILCSHLGRPQEGEFDSKFSLQPVAEYLQKQLNITIPLIKDWQNSPVKLKDGEVVLLENVRFNKGEAENSTQLSKSMASLCDIFVMDAFAVAHRAHSSTCGVAEYANVSCAGPLLIRELDCLDKFIDQPTRPMVALVGGSKVSTKLAVLKSLIKLCDHLIPAGGIANTFIAAAGYNIGKSLVEKNQLNTAKELLQTKNILIPEDVLCVKEITDNATTRICLINEVEDDEIIVDIGPITQKKIADIFIDSKTIVWNGPVGIFEIDNFAKGTEAVAKAISDSEAFSIAGGGDTLAAIEKYQIENDISYISTGGGAFLEFIEGKKLPAVVALEKQAKKL